MIRVTLALPPTVNNAYVNRNPKKEDGAEWFKWAGSDKKKKSGARGRALSTEARDYKAKAKQIVTAAMNYTQWEPSPKSDIILIMRLYFKQVRHRDVSNCIKLLEDAVATAIGVDDRWVVMPLAIRAGVDKHDPRVELTIYSIPNGEVVARQVADYAEGFIEARWQ